MRTFDDLEVRRPELARSYIEFLKAQPGRPTALFAPRVLHRVPTSQSCLAKWIATQKRRRSFRTHARYGWQILPSVLAAKTSGGLFPRPASVELAPPWVRTELLDSLEEERAMPLDQFLAESMAMLATDADEILVGQAPQMRANPGLNEHGWVNQFNDLIAAGPPFGCVG